MNQHDFYVDAMTGTAQDKKEIEKNKKLMSRFPWLWPSDLMFERISKEEYDYSWTVLDEFPVGWKKAFGEQMCDEIQTVLTTYGCVDLFHIDQLKEKYGCMRLYFSMHTKDDEDISKERQEQVNECYDRIQEVISRYEDVSEKTCCECGKPATRMTTGWICPYCDECASAFGNTVPIKTEHNKKGAKP